jgi:tRNA threonylcarbamoyladenosine biosynthesis protein TsaB
MNLLAFDISTERLSVAVQAAAQPATVWQHEGAGGALSSASLIPCIEALMARAGLDFGQLQAIVFGRGPGSFTGLRSACAVAQGLAWGAGLPVLPVDTLLAVAEDARFQQASGPMGQAPACRVWALLDARMDQIYAGCYQFSRGLWRTHVAPALLRSEQLSPEPGCLMAGNVFAAYGQRLPAGPRLLAWPSATALLRLAPALLAAGGAGPADQALPSYIRDDVAQTMLQRAARNLR